MAMAPGTSSFGRGPRAGSRSTNGATTVTVMATMTLMKNAHLQETASVRSPPRTAPVVNPAAMSAPFSPSARERAGPSGNIVVISDSAAGVTIAIARRLNVEQTIVDDNGRSLVKPPKDNEIRSVPAPRFVIEMLVEQGEGMGSDDLLFRSPRGRPLRNRHERGRWFDAAADAIGVPELTPHALRHTAASLAISAGASVLAVQRMLGHSSATVTLDVYSELFDGDLDELGDRLDRVRAESRLRGSYANDSDLTAE